MYQKNSKSPKGVTFIELLIVMAVAGILLVIVTRFIKSSRKVYNLQEDIAERDQNAYYSIKMLSERLMEAGANLPDTNTNYNAVVINTNPANSFKLMVNPRGGFYTVVANFNSNRILVDDGGSFKNADSILVVHPNNSTPTRYDLLSVAIAPTNFDTLKLLSAQPFSTGDQIYAFTTESYLLINNNLCVKTKSTVPDTLAENIDSLTILFKDVAGFTTTDWKLMRYANLSITTRIQRANPALGADSCKRRTLSMELGFRNKI